MRARQLLAAAILAAGLFLSASAAAQMGTAGVSDFLAGVWKSHQGEMSYLLLHNPTGRRRDAVILYYGEKQRFLGCEVLRLTPHDFAKPSLKLPPADETAPALVLQGQGVVEIRSAPSTKEDPNHPGGLTGYVQVVDGESIYEFHAASPPAGYSPRGLTLGIAPLFPVDPRLFTRTTPDIRENTQLVERCVCNKLDKLQSPDELRQIFCRRIE